MRPAGIAPSLLIAALFITSGGVIAETSDQSIGDWSISVSEGISGGEAIVEDGAKVDTKGMLG